MRLQLIFVIFAIFISSFVTNLVFADDETFSYYLDKVWYQPRDVIQVSGWVNIPNYSEFVVETINPDNFLIKNETIPLDDHEIDHTIPTLGQDWEKPGFYKVRITVGNETQTRYFGFGDFDPLEFEPEISFDKERYSWTDTVKITVLSPVDNTANNQLDKIKVDISSNTGKLSSYVLEETGLSHGVFSGLVTLTGHSDYDVNGDGRKGDAEGLTYGSGPEEGYLSVYPNDQIKVTFSPNYFEKSIEKIAPVQFLIGKVMWLDEIEPGKKSHIRVIDQDMSLHSEFRDRVTVLVGLSPSYSLKEIELGETGDNTGIFEGSVKFAKDPDEDGILVSSGDVVFVKYEDRTLPSSYSKKSIELIKKETVIDSQEEIITNKESDSKEGPPNSSNNIELDYYSKPSENSKANYYFNQGFSALYLGEKDKAISFFDSALHEDPNFVSALVNKGIVLFQLGRLKESIQVYDEALELEPENPYTLNNKGFALMSMGNFQEAIIYYKKSIELEPLYLTALYNIADALRQEWYCEDALYYYDKITEIETKDPYAFNYKAWVLASLGRDEEAVSMLDKVLELDPEYQTNFTSFPILIDEEKWSESYWENILKKYPHVWNGVSQKKVEFLVAVMSKNEIDKACIKESLIGLDKKMIPEYESEISKNKIPEWVKNNAKWWSEDTIGDKDFTTGIGFLIKEGIVTIPETKKVEGTNETKEIPSWIKNNAKWWSEGMITDDDFAKGIQYLVEQGIIMI